jgi:hypothetical protein
VTLDKAFYNLLFKQEVVAAPPHYFHIFFLSILLCIHYVVYINDNNAVINKNYGRLKTLCGPSKFPWACARISSKFLDNFGKQPQKGLLIEAVVRIHIAV